MAEVLVVEDEPEVLELVRLSLERDGHTVRDARDGQEALANLDGVEVVVLDLVLPDIDGVEVLRAIRVRDVDVPVVVLTARDGLRDKIEALDSGAFDYIVKPFAPEELLARVRAAQRVRDAQSIMAELAEKLRAEQIYDPLTELPNRRALEFRLGEECARMARGLGPSSVMLCDIDGVGEINDELGVDVGDRAICEVADIISATCRRSDVVFRYGGEEFFVLLSGSATEGARAAAERAAAAVRRSSVIDGRPVTLSIGVAQMAVEDSVEGAIDRVRRALDSARALGPDSISVARPEGE